MLDCGKFKPYEVLEFSVEFSGDPGEILKLWIVALNDAARSTLICFKPTATLKRYIAEPLLLEGCVEYQPGELPFFPERTVIGVDPYPIAYHLLRRCHINTKLQMVGEMPPDFPAKLKKAIENRPDWSRVRKKLYLETYGLAIG